MVSLSGVPLGDLTTLAARARADSPPWLVLVEPCLFAKSGAVVTLRCSGCGAAYQTSGDGLAHWRSDFPRCRCA